MRKSKVKKAEPKKAKDLTRNALDNFIAATCQAAEKFYLEHRRSPHALARFVRRLERSAS